MTRQCNICHLELPLVAFHRNASRRFGVAYQCRDCKRRIYEAQREHVLQRSKHTKDARTTEMRREDYHRRKTDPKFRARQLLRTAVVLGKVKKPKQCPECGRETVIHGHHTDYSKPLEVEWLCGKCHSKRHRVTVDQAKAELAAAKQDGMELGYNAGFADAKVMARRQALEEAANLLDRHGRYVAANHVRALAGAPTPQT